MMARGMCAREAFDPDVVTPEGPMWENWTPDATAALCALLAGGWSVLPPEPIVSSGTLDPATKREWDIQGQLGQWVSAAALAPAEGEKG